MTNLAYTIVADCQCWAMQSLITPLEKEKRLVLAAGPLEVLELEILGPLAKKKYGNQQVIVLTNQYTKMTKTIPVTKVKLKSAATLSVNNWVSQCEVLTYHKNGNGLQFVSKFFAVVEARLGTKYWTTTAYQLCTNGQVEQHHKTVVARPREYVAEHRTAWNY